MVPAICSSGGLINFVFLRCIFLSRFINMSADLGSIDFA